MEATGSGVHRSSNHHHSSSRSSNGRVSTESYKSIRNKHRDQYAEDEGEEDDDRLSEDAVTSMSLLGGNSPSNRRTRHSPSSSRSSSSRWKFTRDDFYTRVVDEWRKTRRKKLNWRTLGRFIFTLLREAILAKWTVQIQIILLITIFTITLVFTIHIYHHSHFAPYPWRQHCASQPPFPINKYVQEEPVGVLVGVMTMASEKAAKQRNRIRKSWASHWASRGRWDEGQIWSSSEMNQTLPDNIRNPTSRVVVRFIMGWPKPEFRAAIQEEIQKYNDIVIVPMKENMNDGKSFAFFDWSFKHALVPPTSNLTETAASLNSFTSSTRRGEEEVREPHRNQNDGSKERPNGWAIFRHSETRPPAPHDPLGPDRKPFKNKEEWVRPDYVVKVDDDSFIMLAELEARLRVLPKKGVYWGYPVRAGNVDFHAGEAYALSWDLVGHVSTYARRNRPRTMPALSTSTSPHVLTVSTGETEKRTREGGSGQPIPHQDGSGNVGSSPRRHRQRYRDLALQIAGREDQVTAGWMKDHGEEWGVTWYDERCWIYDHPKAGTVYSKGFLFPWEINRIKDEWNPGLRPGLLAEARETGQAHSKPEYKRLHDPSYSSVLRPFYRFSYPFAPKWDTLYSSPLPAVNYSQLDEYALKMRTEMELVSLIEGSELSMLVVSSGSSSDDDGEIGRRWSKDFATGWKGRYMLDVPLESSTGAKRLRIPIGGTVVVHFVKRPEYWKECVDILLEGWAHERALKEARQYLI